MGKNGRSKDGAVALDLEFLDNFDIGDIIGQIAADGDILAGYEWPDFGLYEWPDFGLDWLDKGHSCINSRMS